MAGLADLFQGLLADLDSAEFPGVPGTGGHSGKTQDVDTTDISRLSRISRSQNTGRGISDLSGSENLVFSSPEIARNEIANLGPGNPGTPGKHPETLAGSCTYDFPVSSSLPGKNDGYREIEQQLAASPDLALPIRSADVRAGVDRELRALADLGRQGPDALRDAIAITAAKIRNSEALAERQANGSRCHACEESLNDGHPVVAVLTGKRGAHLYLHARCLDAHSARRAALVDSIMAAAGYGPGQSEVAA